MTNGWQYTFEPLPWEDIAQRFDGLADQHEVLRTVASIPHSVIDTESTDLVAGLTSMYSVIVVSRPIPDPPLDVVAVRSAGFRMPGGIDIEHLTVSGHNDRIMRPADQAIPLFWRFMIEKFGIYPARPPN